MDHFDSWIPFFPCIADGRAVVGLSVVNKNDFEIGVCLVNDRGDAFVQIFLDLINRNNSANQLKLIIIHSL